VTAFRASASGHDLIGGPRLGQVAFRAIGTGITVLTTHPEIAPDAAHVAAAYLREVDAAVSRFRDDSEVALLWRRAEGAPASTFVSEVFADHLTASLRAAVLTDGLVDATVGSAVVASGYDADLDVVRTRLATKTGLRATVPGWRTIRFDPTTRHLAVAAGTLLDLGATAKAHAADVIAARLTGQFPGGFLIDLGGDIAFSGDVPAGGWQIGIEAADGHVLQVVGSTGQAITTSSTRLRTWSTDEGPRHHIVDPRTGRTAAAYWAQVSCAGVCALEANAASTAAIVLGADAPAWLAARGIPARLDGADGSVVTTPGWPDPSEPGGGR
jgi:FAD:protein FMN transferase